MLVDELRELRAHLAALDRKVVGLLRSGVAESSVSGALGSSPPLSVVQWFGWCNGVESEAGQIQDDVNVIPGYNPLSIDEATGMMGSYSGDPVLGESWVPLLGSAGGDIYAAVWTSGRDAQIAGVLIGESTEIEFPGIEQMVAFFNACYRVGAFFVDQGGRLSMTPDLYDEVYMQVSEDWQ